MGKTSALKRKEVAISHNMQLLGYLATKSARKALMLYQQDYDFIAKYKDYKKDEKAFKDFDIGYDMVKKPKRIAKLT